MTDNDEEYITVEAAASILRVSVRQATRYASRVTTRQAGKRILFHRGEVEELAKRLGAENKPLVPTPSQMVPAGEMLAAYESQRQQIERQQQHAQLLSQQIASLNRELGHLQGVIDGQKPIIDEYPSLQQRLREIEAERDRLRTQLHEVEQAHIQEALEREQEKNQAPAEPQQPKQNQGGWRSWFKRNDT